MPFEVFIISLVAIIGSLAFLKFVVDRIVMLVTQRRRSDPDLVKRFERLEQRMANIETIVIEREKKSEFERSL